MYTDVLIFLSRAPRSFSFGLARFAHALADVFEKNEKKNKTTSVYRLFPGVKDISLKVMKIISMKRVLVYNVHIHYIKTNKIPGELSRENLISSHVKISPLLWLHNKSRLSHQKTIKVKWFGISLVFI